MSTLKKVYKYMVLLDEPCTIEMPRGAQILSVQTQHGHPQKWALVDTTAPIERRHFEVYGTSHGIRNPERLSFVGTFLHRIVLTHSWAGSDGMSGSKDQGPVDEADYAQRLLALERDLLTQRERDILAPCSTVGRSDDVDGRTVWNLFESVDLFPNGGPKIREELLPCVEAWARLSSQTTGLTYSTP